MFQGRLKIPGWLLLWCSLLLCVLVCRPPLPVDETRYLSVAWEMWQSDQWLVPHINGEPYSHKPPLLFWLIHAGWSVFGVNEWSARITAPLFGLMSILLSTRLSFLLWPENRYLHKHVPYLLLGTCFWTVYSTLTMFDMLISCFALVAWIGLWKSRRQWTMVGWLLYAAATGLGLLAKGPVILVYILPPALLAPLWLTIHKGLNWFRWYGGLLAAVVSGILIALVWALSAAGAGGEQYGQAILFGQTTGRVIHSFAHQRPFYWYLLLLPLLFYPWSLCMPAWSIIKRIQLTAPVKFCLSIVCPGILLLSLISGKQVHYLLPLLPPSFLLYGHLSGKSCNRSGRWLLPISLLVFSATLFIVPNLPLQGGDREVIQYLPQWIGVGPLSACLLLIRPVTAQHIYRVRTAVLLSGLFIFFHLALAGPLHTRYRTTDIKQLLLTAQTMGREILVYPARLSDQFQFAGRLIQPVFPAQTLEIALGWCQGQPEGMVIMLVSRELLPADFFNGLVRPYKDQWLVLATASSIMKSYGELQ